MAFLSVGVLCTAVALTGSTAAAQLSGGFVQFDWAVHGFNSANFTPNGGSQTFADFNGDGIDMTLTITPGTANGVTSIIPQPIDHRRLDVKLVSGSSLTWGLTFSGGIYAAGTGVGGGFQLGSPGMSFSFNALPGSLVFNDFADQYIGETGALSQTLTATTGSAQANFRVDADQIGSFSVTLDAGYSTPDFGTAQIPGYANLVFIFAPASAPQNAPPDADAGPDQSPTVPVGQSVQLNGSLSSDPDLDPLTFQWTLIGQPLGSGATLIGANTATPSFVPDVDGDYTAELVVNDGTVDSAADQVLISVAVDNPPTANAGLDQLDALTATAVQLDGGLSSDDLTASVDLQYAWTISSAPGGSTANLVAGGTSMPSFIPDVAGSYAIDLVVTDASSQASAIDQVLITAAVPNAAPTADAGADATTAVNVALQLDGNASSDPDLDPVTFQWTLTSAPAGSAAMLAADTTATPSLTADLPGTYVVELVVNDGFLDSSVDSVEIEAIDTADFVRAKIHEADDYVAGLPLSSFYSGNGNCSPQRQAKRAKISKRAMRKALRVSTWHAFWHHWARHCNGGSQQISLHKKATLRQLRRAIALTDGVALRGTPDVRGSGFRVDLITDAVASQTVYDCLQQAITATEAAQ